MQLTVRQKLRFIGALGVLGIVAITALAVISQNRLSSAIDRQVVTARALKNQVEMDMMHDALRGDVYGALLAQSDEERNAARADVAEHAELMRSLLAENEALDLPDDVIEATRAVADDVDTYTTSAIELVDVALASPVDGRAGLPAFIERFEALEASLAGVSDGVEASAASAAADARDGADAVRTLLLVAAALVAVGVGVSVWRIAASITGRLQRIVDALDRVADLDLTVSVADDRHDELGRMSRALDRTVAATGVALASIRKSADRLGQASEHLEQASRLMGGHAEQATDSVMAVSSAASQVSASVQHVAAGTDELSASVRDIARSTSEAAQVATEGVDTTVRTAGYLRRLGDSSNEIVSVVDVVASIAEQTNLLALNATIEAARAGEAGRGFAVVANEVKDLAQATARATADIKQKIEAIVADTGVSVTAIDEVVTVIHRINDIQSSIASAVEEQSATTDEIARSLAEAAGATDGITSSIGVVAGISQETTAIARDTQAAASELRELASELRSAVARFCLATTAG